MDKIEEMTLKNSVQIAILEDKVKNNHQSLADMFDKLSEDYDEIKRSVDDLQSKIKNILDKHYGN